MHYRFGNELGSIVTAPHGLSAPLGNQCFQMFDEAVGGDGSFEQAADTFAGVFIHDRTNLRHLASLTNVELKINCPHRIGGIRRGVDRRAAHQFAPLSTGYPKSFVTPQTLKFFIIRASQQRAFTSVSYTVRQLSTYL